MGVRVLQGDCRDVLPTLASGSVHCVVTSPPYFGLRDYGTATWMGGSADCDHGVRRWASAKHTQGAQSGHASKADRLDRGQCARCGAVRADRQIGHEDSLNGYIDALVQVFREVKRVLRDDGLLWLNLGDCYANSPSGSIGATTLKGSRRSQTEFRHAQSRRSCGEFLGAKPKDLLMVPARVALALQSDGQADSHAFAQVERLLDAIRESYPDDTQMPAPIRREVARLEQERLGAGEGGWWLRSDVIWHKANVMPESVLDRPTSAHEHVFLFAKSGAPTFWVHRDGKGTRARPAPDYRWQDTDAGESETPDEPPGWAEAPSAVDPSRKRWRRASLWRGHDYYYDAEAIREPSECAPRNGRKAPRDAPLAALPPRHAQYGAQHTKLDETGRGAGRNARNVWTLPSQPLGIAHYAVMPPTLAERCIRAATSERGCCPHCGAPWARRVERRTEHCPNAARAGTAILGKGHVSSEVRAGHDVRNGPVSVVETVGWHPTCACPAHQPRPCTVLDPFSGAGTTGLVADRLQRDAVLIDLSSDFKALAAGRIRSDAPLLAHLGD